MEITNALNVRAFASPPRAGALKIVPEVEQLDHEPWRRHRRKELPEGVGVTLTFVYHKGWLYCCNVVSPLTFALAASASTSPELLLDTDVMQMAATVEVKSQAVDRDL